MRIRTYVLLSALVLAPAAARAQEAATPPDAPQTGQVDVGAQVTSVSGDEARYERYRDLRSGPLLDGFNYLREKNDWTFAATASHVGYRDQKYTVGAHRAGRVKMSFTWDQIPLFYVAEDSDQYGLIGATPYRVESPGVYRIDDGVQTAVQGKQLSLYNAVVGQALPFEIRQQRNIADFRLVYTLSKDVDLIFHLVNTTKTGEQPWAASFGFSHAVELPGPVDTRSTDVTGQVQWGNDKGSLTAGYDGSFFHNNVPTLIWDNPLRISDQTYASAYSPGDGTSQGRESLWPDSSTNGVSATAAYNLPMHSRVFGNVNFSKWTQDNALLPHTINAAIPVIPLDRTTSDVSADVTAAYLGFHTRPTDKVWFSARYKVYDYQNNTPELPVTDYVRIDQVVEAWALGHTENFSYTRQYLDADFSYNLTTFTAVRAGYGLEHDKRTFRQFESTSDNTFRVSLDTTGVSWLMLRAQYDHSKRSGNGLDEEVFDSDNEGAAMARQYDISDRNRNRYSVITSFTPTDLVSFSVSGGYVKDDRPDKPFGLETTDGKFVSVGVDLSPMPKVDVFAEYGYEKYTSLQKSRQANPGSQEFDLTRDWTTAGSDRANTVLAGVTLKKIADKTDVDWSLEYSNAADSYLYGLRADQTIFTTTPLVQLPGFTTDRTSSMLNVMYYLSKRLGVGAGWLYETFNDSDFAWSADTLNALSLPRNGVGAQQAILTRYMYRPYTGNTGYFRLRYLF
jgi:MtrB/PioB family decaheme-associated outer membrane protein